MTDKTFKFEDLPLRDLYSLQKELYAQKGRAGYSWWKDVVGAQVLARQMKLCEPLSGEANAVYVQEFEKGEVQGLTFASRLWDLLGEEVDAEIQRRRDSMTPDQLAQDEAREE